MFVPGLRPGISLLKEETCDIINNMKRIFNILAIILIVTIMLTGCAHKDKTDRHEPILFGATYMTRNNVYFDVLHAAIEEVVESNGDILISRDPNQQQDKQNDQIIEMIEEGIQVLFLNPVDWEEVRPALEACKEAGVIVINVDTIVKDTEYIVTCVETDNYMAGRLCAEDMMARMNSADIVIIDNPIQKSIANRVQGFLDTIEGNDNYRVVYTAVGKGEFEVSAEALTEFLKTGTHFNVFFGGNDPSALGALAALQQNRMENEGIEIYGVDGAPDFKSMVALGHTTATSAQSPKTLGTVAAQAAYQYLNGEKIEPYISIKPYIINKENISNYEVNGWQ